VRPLRINCLAKSFLFACLILPATMRADIIVNGGFETTSVLPTTPGGILYNASPWVIVDPNIPPDTDAATGVCLTSSCGSPFGPHNGSAYFYGGAWDGVDHQVFSPGTVSQSVPTSSLTLYVLSFWLAQPVAGSFNGWEVTWDGVTFDGGIQLGTFPYVQVNLLLLSSTAGSDTVKFSFYDSTPNPFAPAQNQAPALAGFELDDVSINPLLPGQDSNFINPTVVTTSVLPEPGSGLLVAMFFVAAGLMCVFKKKSASARASAPSHRLPSVNKC
jgi:hypothetical protein